MRSRSSRRSARGADEHPEAKHELLQSTIEIITGICTTVEEAKADLAGTLAEVAAAAEQRGLGLMCAGTHPFTDWQSQLISPKERYLQLVEQMRWLARRLQIFGVHVHVGVRSPDKAIPIVNALCQYVPHFLALSASSPFWVGCDTGLASSRTKVFESMPTAGLPYQLSGWDEFETYMETLISTNAIESVREVWWDIRPHPDFGTVELRICDGLPTLDEIGAVAALSQCLVEQFDTQLDRGYTLPTPASWVLRENKWRAARYGLDADIVVDEKGTVRPVRQAILDLVEDLTPTAKRLGCEAELADVERVLAVGASYQRQRAVAAQRRRPEGGRRQPARRDARRPARHGSGRGSPGRCPGPADCAEDTRHDPGRREAGLRGRRLGRQNNAQLVATRRHLHAHPELAFAEFETTSFLEQRLRAVGLSPRRLPTGTGLVCEVGSGDPVVVLRADIDALPLPDLKDVPYASTREGLCHACGHDVHTTVVLGVAMALAALDGLPGTVRLHLPAGRGDPPRRRHRGRRLRRPRRRLAGVRAALRPVGAGGQDRPAHRGRSPRPATGSTSRCSAPAGTPPGRSSPSTSSTPSAG